MLQEDDGRQLVVVAHPLELVLKLFGLLAYLQGVGRGIGLGLRKRRPSYAIRYVADGVAKSLADLCARRYYYVVKLTVSLFLLTASTRLIILIPVCALICFTGAHQEHPYVVPEDEALDLLLGPPALLEIIEQVSHVLHVPRE